MTTLSNTMIANRIKLVDEHVRVENNHDLDNLMQTFGDSPTFDINGEIIDGREGIHGFYSELMQGFPDLHIDVKEKHVCDDAVIVECVVGGTHRNMWRGIEATGKYIQWPACVIFRFDEKERLAGEWAYYDSVPLLTAFGLMPAPGSE